ncbi:MAG TPA: ATP phosphoribosyltransferase regulatory subunit, partial [Pirellulaceae bacterium]
TRAQAESMVRLAEVKGSADDVALEVESLVEGSSAGERGLAALREIVADIRAAGVPDQRFVLDLSIARGLDYYSGLVIETMLDDLPGIGSVCSGGRYDDLASVYINQRLPGVGASLGLDRILTALEELAEPALTSAVAPILIVQFDQARRHDYLRLASRLRAVGVGAEFYPEPRKIATQLKYADARGFPWALVVGSREFDAGIGQLKDLQRRTSLEVPLGDERFESGVMAALGMSPHVATHASS